MSTTEYLLDLLPVHVRTRDEQTGGLLRALLDAVAGELEVLECDLDELYASWFVESAPEWVVPYLADLVGVADLPPYLPDLGVGEPGTGPSRRAFVANTLAYRRRKGTPAAIEQVARDVTGWPARVVEYHRLLTTTAHTRHVRLDRPATASLRSADRLDLVPPTVASGALDLLAHTGEVRHLDTGRGRYAIHHVGVFLLAHLVGDFAVREEEVAWPPAVPTDDGWSVHPLGRPAPLVARAATEHTIEHLAGEADLPVPLRPRRLLALLREARAGGEVDLPVAVRIDDEPLDPLRVRVCGLEDLATDGGDPLPGWQVMVDTVTGRLRTYLAGLPDRPGTVRVRHAYATTADVGAGTYDRASVHEALLTGFPGDGDTTRPDVRGHEAAEPPGGLAGALDRTTAAWTDVVDPTAGGTSVVSVGDHEVYPAPVVHVPAATRLVLVAAAWRDRVVGSEIIPRQTGQYDPDGLRPVIDGDLTLTGDAGSAVVVDGFVVTGDVVIGAGDLGQLVLAHCTVAGRVRAEEAAAGVNAECQVDLVRTVAGGVDLAGRVPALALVDSIVDAVGSGGGGESSVAPPAAVAAEGAHVSVTGSTVRGTVRARTLQATSALLDGAVTVQHRQTGCVRYSYVGPASRVPRRFRCVPPTDGATGPAPVYAAVEPGSPDYLALAPQCAPAIAEGGEGGSEMGVHHHLGRPLRVAAARRLLDPFVPVGVEIGLLGS